MAGALLSWRRPVGGSECLVSSSLSLKMKSRLKDCPWVRVLAPSSRGKLEVCVCKTGYRKEICFVFYFLFVWFFNMSLQTQFKMYVNSCGSGWRHRQARKYQGQVWGGHCLASPANVWCFPQSSGQRGRKQTEYSNIKDLLHTPYQWPQLREDRGRAPGETLGYPPPPPPPLPHYYMSSHSLHLV